MDQLKNDLIVDVCTAICAFKLNSQKKVSTELNSEVYQKTLSTEHNNLGGNCHNVHGAANIYFSGILLTNGTFYGP